MPSDRIYNLFGTLLILTSLMLLSGCGYIQQTREAQIDLAQAYHQAQLGNTKSARQWADRAIAVNPKAVATYVTNPDPASPSDRGQPSIAAIFSAVGDTASVVYYMQQAARKFPNSYWPPLVLEQVHGMQGNKVAQKATAKSLAALLEKKLTTPGTKINARLIGFLAQAYWDSGNPTQGVANYQRAISAYPGDFNSYNGLAYAYAVANDKPHLPQALTLAQKAVALAAKGQDDELAETQDTLGWVQYRLGDDKNAEINIMKAMNVLPREPEIRYHLGMVYLAEGNPQAARAELTAATLLSQGYAAAQTELARLAPKAGAPALKPAAKASSPSA